MLLVFCQILYLGIIIKIINTLIVFIEIESKRRIIYFYFNLFELLISKWKVTRRPKTTNKKHVILVKTHVHAYVTYVYVQQKTLETWKQICALFHGCAYVSLKPLENHGRAPCFFFFLIFIFYRPLRRRPPVARLKSQIKSVTIGPVVFESRPSKVTGGDPLRLMGALLPLDWW